VGLRRVQVVGVILLAPSVPLSLSPRSAPLGRLVARGAVVDEGGARHVRYAAAAVVTNSSISVVTDRIGFRPSGVAIFALPLSVSQVASPPIQIRAIEAKHKALFEFEAKTQGRAPPNTTRRGAATAR
jgi:hypothetical protein